MTDPPLTSQIIESLEIINSPHSSNQQRMQAHQVVEALKRHPDSLAIGKALAKNSLEPVFVRYFGLGIIEYCIQGIGGQANYEILKQIVLELFTIELQNNFEEALIFQKLSSLFVELAKRIWPANWMNLNEILMNMYHGNFASQIMC